MEKAKGLLDSGIGLVSSLVTKKVDEIHAETEKKAEEIKEEVVESAYEAKRGLIRTLVEGLLLSTGILALIGGLLIFFKEQGIPLYQVLLGYGVVVTLYTLLKMKTSP